MEMPALTEQQEITYINSVDIGCSLEDLPGEMDDRNRCRKRFKEIEYDDDFAHECCELYWTNHGSNIPQNRSCTATSYLLYLKPSKLDE